MSDIESICLSIEEVCQLTNKKQSRSQISALNFMGIEHKIRPDGTVMILRSDIIKTGPSNNKKTPDFGALGDVA